MRYEDRPSRVTRRLNTRDIEDLTGKHRTTIWRWVKAGKFPQPQYINGQRSWSEASVEVWQGQLETYEDRHGEVA